LGQELDPSGFAFGWRLSPMRRLVLGSHSGLQFGASGPLGYVCRQGQFRGEYHHEANEDNPAEFVCGDHHRKMIGQPFSDAI